MRTGKMVRRAVAGHHQSSTSGDGDGANGVTINHGGGGASSSPPYNNKTSTLYSSSSYRVYDHQRRRRRRGGRYCYRGGGGSYNFDAIRQYLVWAALFVVIYLATLLMSHGYHHHRVATSTGSSTGQASSTTTRTATTSSSSALHSWLSSSRNFKKSSFYNIHKNIIFPTSLMLFQQQNNKQQQPNEGQQHTRRHQQRRHVYHDYRANRNVPRLTPGSIRPLPPLLHPYDRDDDYMEPNFGDLDLYLLGDDEHENQRHFDENDEKIIMLARRREILEEERIDPATKPQAQARNIPAYDDEIPHSRQNPKKFMTEEEYYESDYYWYYAMDDDVKRNPYNGWEDDNIQNERHCRRVPWHGKVYPTCNGFHEFDFNGLVHEGASSYVGGGAFRQVFKASTHVDPEPFIFKETSYTDAHYFNFVDMESMRMDGVIAGALQPHPLLVDVYGFCAFSMFSQLMPNGDAEKASIPYFERCDKKFRLSDHDNVEPWNEIEPTTKLEWALQMAEGVALLNNYAGGVIVHDDIQPPQFLPTKDGRLKFNDFNRAEVMLFDEENQEYCRYRNGEGPADWRAPEEYMDHPLNEKIDVWSLGNNFYALLTGLLPFYDECEHDVVQQRIIDGETAYIDPRWRNHSFAEGQLVDIMEKCWEYNPDDRIEIGELVLTLRQAVAENQKHEKAIQRQKR